MSNLKYKIIAYLGKKPDFNSEVNMQNDGQVSFISFWSNTLEKDKPTDEQLNALETEATKLQNNDKADGNRMKEYGTWQEQLDYIYHNGITKWKTDHIKPIKDKYPKE